MTAEGTIPAPELRRLRVAHRRAAAGQAELRAAVAAAATAGGSVRVIAAEIERSPTTIQTWLAQNKKEEEK